MRRRLGTAGTDHRSPDLFTTETQRHGDGLSEGVSVPPCLCGGSNSEQRHTASLDATTCVGGGKGKWKWAPPTEVLAHRRPWCASMMVRLIDRPMPRPAGLVEKNGSKM